MRTGRWLLAFAAAAASACGPADSSEPAVGQTEQALVSTTQAKLADLEVQGLVLLDATKKLIPGIVTSSIPPVVTALVESWGLRPTPSCTSTHLVPDGDGDGVPKSLLVHFDCREGPDYAFTYLVGGILLRDSDNTVMGPGYSIAIDRLSLTKRIPLVGNETRTLTGTVKVVESLEREGGLELSNVLSWKFTTEGTAGISELRYFTHTTAVYVPDEGQPSAPAPVAGLLRFDGNAKLTLPSGAVLQLRYETERPLHHSLVCERKFPQGLGFDSGVVVYEGDAPLRIEMRRCNTWTAAGES